ncbi:MAG: hypothetical protein AAGD35_02480 [Actinomycetota bacterium]
MRIRSVAGAAIGATTAVAVGAMTAQHRRYLALRRNAAQDRQDLLPAKGSFHALFLLRAPEGDDVIELTDAFFRATGDLGEVAWIYAGKVVGVGRSSNQIDDEWDVAVLMQFSSEAYFRLITDSIVFRRALQPFAQVHVQGFERPRLLNAALPQVLLARRLRSRARREEPALPLTPDEHEPTPERTKLAEQLLAERELGADAVVVVNLIKHGDDAQREADGRYTDRMLGAMAEGGYGPLHLGPTVGAGTTRDNDAATDFDRVALVYYPGVEFFADLLRSSFLSAIIGDKQLADSSASITVPILDRLPSTNRATASSGERRA